jgi:hypothetical protein
MSRDSDVISHDSKLRFCETVEVDNTETQAVMLYVIRFLAVGRFSGKQIEVTWKELYAVCPDETRR